MSTLATLSSPDFQSYPGVSIGTAVFGISSYFLLSELSLVRPSTRGWIAVVFCGLMVLWVGALMPLIARKGGYSVHANIASYIAYAFGAIYGLDAFRSGGWHRRALGACFMCVFGGLILFVGYRRFTILWHLR